jgi:LacI family transcriptional regulator
MAVTLRQVAEQAGVSAATVSRILTGSRAELFPEATRRKVHAAAESLGYRPNLAARSLQKQRSYLIGVLINASNATISTEFLRGVQTVLNSGDFSPIVFSHTDCAEQANCLQRCIDRRVDGLIVNASHDEMGRFDTSGFKAYLERGAPVIEVFGWFLPGVPQINVHNVAAGRVATEHLIALGHRRIAMLTHERYQLGRNEESGLHFDAWDRSLGYEEAMNTTDLEPLVLTHPITGEIDVSNQFVEGGVAAYSRLLAHPEKPTAVVCYNDLEAFGLIRAARLQGDVITERLSLVGFGDLDHSRIIVPALTTVPVPAFEVGRRAAQGLLDRIEGCEVESALIESEIVIRESTVERKH